MIQDKYALEWFDFIVLVTLNPSQTNVSALTTQQASIIEDKAFEEKEKIKLFLKDQAFALQSHKKIDTVIRQYYIALVILFDKSYENRGAFDQQTGYLRKTYKSVIDSISELLSFIEERFSAYISLDDRVPLAYLMQTKEELRARVEDLKVDLVEAVGNKDLTSILLHSLYGFTNETPKRQVTFREVFYKKDLVTEIEKINNLAEESRKHDALIDCLVCLNFNSRAFMNYYTQKVAQRVNAYGSLKEKMTQLLLCYKEFNQMHHKLSVRLNPSYEGIKKVVGNWFAQEITYLEKKHHWNVSPLVPDGTTQTRSLQNFVFSFCGPDCDHPEGIGLFKNCESPVNESGVSDYRTVFIYTQKGANFLGKYA